ncbi:MAG: phosphatase PAP2 family protein [Bacteroidia bacterium]|nr:phosphatase PAP2 family protein [Bacteroidia bacterium]
MIFFATTLWQKLEEWDKWLFIQINSHGANPFFDVIMPFLRNPPYWAPLYLFMLVFVLVNFKSKGLWWAVFFIATVSLTDMIGTNIFKYGFQRIRPCNNPDLLTHLRLLVRCPSGYGFVSNHAANHFGMATFLFITFRHLFKNWMWLAFLWAGSIAYAQVYVGIHYPFDIVGGTALGIVFGTFTGLIFNKYFKLFLKEKNIS